MFSIILRPETLQELSNFQDKEEMCKFLGQGTTESASGLAFSRRGEEENDDDDGYGDGEKIVVVDVAESTGKKIEKRKKSTIEEIKVGRGQLQLQLQFQDPLNFLGHDIMHLIISFLDAPSVALCLLVSRGWHGVACSDRLWSPKCEELWVGKAHVPRVSRTRGLSKLHVYSLSVMDGRRLRITRDDLCDHVWDFHFREAAPEYWRNLDPYWQGTGERMHRYFHQDGSQTCGLDDKVWGGHEACYCVVTGLEGDGYGKIREHYVRINRWPQLYISRKQDWSWEMSNHLCHYSSVPDPEKHDGTGPFFHFY